MGVSASLRKDCGRWQVTARRYGKKKSKLALAGMGKREAIRVVGDKLLRLLDAEEDTRSERARPPKLWNFCAEVYSKNHGVSKRTWDQRKYKVAAIMEDLGHYRLHEVKTQVVRDWLRRLETEGAPLKKGGRGEPQGKAAKNDFQTVPQCNLQAG